MSDLRRSPRLQQNGYYGPDGNPVISYKEIPFKVFKSRKVRPHRQSPVSPVFPVSPLSSEDLGEEQPQSPGSKINFTKIDFTKINFTKIFIDGFYILLTICFLASLGSCLMWIPQNQTKDGRILHNPLLSKVQSWDTRRLQSDDRMWTSKELYPELSIHKASVLEELSSDTYFPFGLYHYLRSWVSTKHQQVLQPGHCLKAFSCWPFAGDRGHIHIELQKPAQIHYITLGHITKQDSPIGKTTSAPQKFSVYGMQTAGGEETLLGKFFYNAEDGPPFQTFPVNSNSQSYKHVRVEVESNWGNPDYTCVYSIRVHGILARPVETESIKT